MITASTRLFALLGDPVGHSLSPRFQNAAFRAAGQDAVYLALPCAGGDLAPLLGSIARAGGGGNVTVPHKRAAAEAVERRTAAVDRTGACNTFWREGGAVWGDNTDVAGAAAAIRAVVEPAGVALDRVLVLGAGGAAAAVLAALEDLGAADVTLANRSPEGARALAERFRSARMTMAPAGLEPATLDGEWDLAVNATSLGLGGETPPFGPARIRAGLDLVYAPHSTPWVRSLVARGVPAADGTEMLLHQGAAAFRRWFGAEPDLARMRAALQGAGG